MISDKDRGPIRTRVRGHAVVQPWDSISIIHEITRSGERSILEAGWQIKHPVRVWDESSVAGSVLCIETIVKSILQAEESGCPDGSGPEQAATTDILHLVSLSIWIKSCL
jgi:hypothetical protein